MAVAFSSILAVTLVPVLMLIFIRGHLRPESTNPLSRWTQALYLPVLRLCLRYRKTTLLLNLLFLVVTFPLAPAATGKLASEITDLVIAPDASD